MPKVRNCAKCGSQPSICIDHRGKDLYAYAFVCVKCNMKLKALWKPGKIRWMESKENAIQAWNWKNAIEARKGGK